MIRCIKCTVFILLFCLSLGSVQAQPIEQVDPQGLQHAVSLYEAWSNNNQAVLEPLLTQNPNLTKRAFVAGLYYAGEGNVDEGETEQVLTFLIQLAQWISENLGDPIPMQIAQTQDEAQLASYRDQLLSGASNASTSLVGSSSKTDEQLINEVVVPLATKVFRLLFASVYNDPELVIQEIDTFPQVIESCKAALAGQADAESQQIVQSLSDADQILSLVRITAMANLGLVENYDELTAPFLANEDKPDTKMAVLVTGMRLAQNQQRLDSAGQFLRRANRLLSTPGYENPVYAYCLRTAGVQQRLEGGETISDSQVINEFNQAWSILSGYKPLNNNEHDLAWEYGRWSTRFWIDQLAGRGDAGVSAIHRIEKDLEDWFDVIGSRGSEVDGQSMDVGGVQGYISVLVNLLDSAIYYAEAGLDEEVKSPETLQDMILVANELGSLDKTAGLELNLSRPGFPHFDLNRTAYVQELRLRINLLKALNAPNDVEKSNQLSALLPELRKVVLPENFIDYHLDVGRELEAIGKRDEAIATWSRALAKSEELGFVSRSVEASALLAEEYGRRGEWQRVSEYAAKANEGLKEEMGVADSKQNFAMAQKSSKLAELEATAHIKSNNPEKALQALSEGHQLTNAASQLSGNKDAAKATVKLRAKKRQVAKLASKVQQLQEMPASGTRDEMIKTAEKVLADSRQAFLLESRKIRQQFSSIYNTSLRFDPLNLPGVQKALPSDAAVVQYFPTENELYIFLVTATDFRLRSVSIKKADLDKQVVAYRRLISRPSVKPSQKLITLSKQLHGFLIEPIEGDLTKSSTVIFIPSGRLNFLPFGSLMDGTGKPLLASKTILELGRTEDLTKIVNSEKKQITNVLALANATLDLPAAEEEGVSIKKIFPATKLLVRGEATKANLKKFGGKMEVLHLATHGTWDATDSLNNHLKLANNERLSQEEIFGLNLEDTSIVTLSACSTALADDEDVGFVASLAEAFWLAGSETVVASLWQVDDNSTGLLMTQFYENLSKGQGKAEALRNAQLSVSKNPKYAHPFFWSGFILFGDYR